MALWVPVKRQEKDGVEVNNEHQQQLTGMVPMCS